LTTLSSPRLLGISLALLILALSFEGFFLAIHIGLQLRVLHLLRRLGLDGFDGFDDGYGPMKYSMSKDFVGTFRSDIAGFGEGSMSGLKPPTYEVPVQKRTNFSVPNQ
jgi:hypothetical protein